MALLHTLRGLCTLVVALPLTLIASTLTWLDLVVGRPGEVAIVEVKTRTSDRFGVPALAVGYAKQARLRRLGAAWLVEHGGGLGRVRFDVASVLAGEVSVIESAF